MRSRRRAALGPRGGTRRRTGARLAVLAAIVAVAGGTLPGTARARPPAAASPSAAPGPHGPGGGVPAADTGREARPGHEDAEGLKLVAAAEADERAAPRHGGRCAAGAPVRRYDVVAIDVDITLNRYLDHDPAGRMYVLQRDLGRVRAEEAQNAKARAGAAEPAVSIGLQGDAIQPLTLRVHQGDCVVITLRNDLPDDEPASLHIHGAGVVLAGTDTAATATEPAAVARAGSSVSYQWMVDADEPEGTHYFHSHGDTRAQTSHGLFGGVIVEPAGSAWLDPITGDDAPTGWDAMIRPRDKKAFRETVLFYHEIGDENYQFLDGRDARIPLVDPITTTYRPGARALNYRSEPFLNRLALQQSLTGVADVSLAYSSYAFGDPATPMPRSYVGDPVKQRVLHGGSETFHVHHVHGGSTRWPRQPGAEDSRMGEGLDKHPPVAPAATERTDSQSIGPSETFDVEHDCGAGGCQQSAGDFMYHCHVSQHYFAGMWGMWRVYNTRQDGPASTDALPPLLELPDREDGVVPAVAASELAGTTVDWSGREQRIEASGLAAWVERQLPPQGVPRGYDASVMDWAREGDRYLNEPEAAQPWPGYRPRAPGSRPPITFDPRTGKLAYPFLRPHLGKRPPFAPNHGPAPFLDPTDHGRDPPAPGASGPASLCPVGTTPRSLAINALQVPVVQNPRTNLVDAGGQLFALRSERDAVLADPARRVPLVVRANAGEDCVDVLLRSELEDNANDPLSKVDIHIHFVQFDVQASDGVSTGFGYEQTIRPFRAAGQAVVAPSAAGATTLTLDAADRFQPGALVGVGMDRDEGFEVRRIAAVAGSVLTFDRPLEYAHRRGEVVSSEFVRYRWYPDIQVGTSFFHEHVNPVVTGRHGLFGALVVEPPGSTYTDRRTGELLASGPHADIRTAGRVSVDVEGSFRESVVFIQDDNPLSRIGRSTGSAFSLRAEPVRSRGPDPALYFSSRAGGDPVTPLLEAYLGDPVVVRSLVASNNEVHTWHLDGHWFRSEAFSATSAPTSTAHLGISERVDLVVPAAGGPQRMPGDYLYYNGRAGRLLEGSWGILRVHGPGAGDGLRPLPGRERTPEPASQVCASGAPERRFDVAAVAVPLPMLGGRPGKIFVLEADREAVLAGAKGPEPLVLRANVGDCIRVDLTNRTDAPVSFHADMLAFDPMESAGVAAGRNPAQAVAPGAQRASTFFASPEVGETVALVRDWADVSTNPRLGLYGAVVVGPEGARYRDPVTGEDAAAASSWRVDVLAPSGPAYRDFALFLQDGDEGIANHRMPYTTNVQDVTAVNYAAAPLRARLDANPDPASVHAVAVHGDPATPVLEAVAGDAVRLHVLAPWSEQSQVFSVEGHRWPVEAAREGSPLLSSIRLGGSEALTLRLDGGAGGPAGLPGDYLYGNHREPYREAGQWGLLRVRAPDAQGTGLLPLPCGPGSCNGAGNGILGPILALVMLVVLAGLGLWGRHRLDPSIRPA